MSKPHITGRVIGATLEDNGVRISVHAHTDAQDEAGVYPVSFMVTPSEARRYGVGQDVWLELRPAPRGGK